MRPMPAVTSADESEQVERAFPCPQGRATEVVERPRQSRGRRFSGTLAGRDLRVDAVDEVELAPVGPLPLHATPALFEPALERAQQPGAGEVELLDGGGVEHARAGRALRSLKDARGKHRRFLHRPAAIEPEPPAAAVICPFERQEISSLPRDANRGQSPFPVTWSPEAAPGKQRPRRRPAATHGDTRSRRGAAPPAPADDPRLPDRRHDASAPTHSAG